MQLELNMSMESKNDRELSNLTLEMCAIHYIL